VDASSSAALEANETTSGAQVAVEVIGTISSKAPAAETNDDDEEEESDADPPVTECSKCRDAANCRCDRCEAVFCNDCFTKSHTKQVLFTPFSLRPFSPRPISSRLAQSHLSSLFFFFY
jgi:hypothetical protein